MCDPPPSQQVEQTMQASRLKFLKRERRAASSRKELGARRKGRKHRRAANRDCMVSSLEARNMRIVIAEKDPALGALLLRTLSAEADKVELTSEAESALARLVREEPDLLVLDGALQPEADTTVAEAFPMLAAVRQVAPRCPVLLLLDGPESRVRCLEQGADDCMARPLSLRELRARCRTMLRRQQHLHHAAAAAAEKESSALTLRLGGLVLQRNRRQAVLHGAPLHLTNREFSLLEQLLLVSGAAVNRAALRSAVWESTAIETNAIDVHMAALRRKLSLHHGAPAIETIRGTGYRLVGGDAAAFPAGWDRSGTQGGRVRPFAGGLQQNS